MRTRRYIFFLCSIVIMALGLAACSAKDETPTATETMTPTVTLAATKAAIPTVTPTATDATTPTATPEATEAMTPTATPTASEAMPPTATPTATGATTPTATPEATEAMTPTVTSTATPVATQAATPTMTPTPVPTTDPTLTPTASPTPLPTAIPTEASEERRTDGILSVFSANDLEGNEVNQSIFDGYKLIMVNVWATFCGPCIGEMPELGEIAAEYEEKSVRIIGLVADAMDYFGNPDQDQVELAQDIVAETGADYLHLQPSDSLRGILGQIDAVPTTFFVDQDGVQVGYSYVGSRSKEEWSMIIDELLEEVK